MADSKLLLRGRLGAARIVLEQADPRCRDSVARCQANAIVDILGRCGGSLTPDDRTTVLEQAMAIPWPAPEMSLICDAIAGPLKKASSDRRKGQDFLAFAHYLDEKRWQFVLSPDAPGSAKEDCLIDLARSLGLEIPSELTFKRMVCLVMMVCEEWTALSTKSAADKKSDLTLFKRKWHVSGRKIKSPATWIQKFPSLPTEYQALYPHLWASTYAEGSCPVPPRIDERRLSLLDASFKARGLGDASTPVLNLAPEQPTQVQSSLIQMGQMMMQGMQQMARQQQQFVEYMTASPSSFGRKPSGLKELLELTSPRSPRDNAMGVVSALADCNYGHASAALVPYVHSEALAQRERVAAAEASAAKAAE